MSTPWRFVSSKTLHHSFGKRLFRLRILHELDRLHDPHPSDLADDRIFLLQPQQLIVKIISDDTTVRS